MATFRDLAGSLASPEQLEWMQQVIDSAWEAENCAWEAEHSFKRTSIYSCDLKGACKPKASKSPLRI